MIVLGGGGGGTIRAVPFETRAAIVFMVPLHAVWTVWQFWGRRCYAAGFFGPHSRGDCDVAVGNPELCGF